MNAEYEPYNYIGDMKEFIDRVSLLNKTALDEADRAAENDSRRYTHEEVFRALRSN